MIILLGIKKYKSSLIITVLFLLFITLCIFFGRIKAVYAAKTALDSVKTNIEALFEDICVPGAFDSSFVINAEFNDNKYLNSLNLLNNTDESGICLSIKGKKNVDIFAHKKNIGISFPDNENISYTAKLKSFPSKWNKSVYAQFFEIPSFIPENLSYKELISYFDYKKFSELSLAFCIGNNDYLIKDLFKNISVTSSDTYVLSSDGKREKQTNLRISLPKKDIKKFISSSKSSEGRFGGGYGLKHIEKYLDNIRSKDVSLLIKMKNQKVIEIFFASDIHTLSVKFFENGITADLNEAKSQKKIIGFSVHKTNSDSIKVIICEKNNYILNINKTKNREIMANLTDEKTNKDKCMFSFAPRKYKFNINDTTKDIFSLSLYDAMCLAGNFVDI